HEHEARQGQVGHARSGKVHRDVDVAAAFGDADDIAARGEDAASIGPAQVLERIRSVGGGRAVDGREVAVEIDARRDAADAYHVDGAVRTDAQARLEAPHDEANGQVTSFQWQRELLVRAGLVDSRHCGRDGAEG